MNHASSGRSAPVTPTRTLENKTMARLFIRTLGALAIVLGSSFVAGCPTVPKEAVELSYQMGTDLDALHDSYDRMVQDRFAGFRAQREEYLDEEWIPTFLRDFASVMIPVAEGKQVMIDDDLVDVGDLNLTVGEKEAMRLEGITGWAVAANEQIEEKRQELLGSLNSEEAKIRRDLEEAFGRLIRANAAITAHLNSIRKVQEVQNDMLDKLGMKEVVDEVNDQLVVASEWAADGLVKIREADGEVDDVVETIDEFKAKLEELKQKAGK